MHLIDKETVEKLEHLPLEKRKKVLDGLAKMLAMRPYRFSGQLETPSSGEEDEP